MCSQPLNHDVLHMQGTFLLRDGQHKKAVIISVRTGSSVRHFPICETGVDADGVAIFQLDAEMGTTASQSSSKAKKVLALCFANVRTASSTVPRFRLLLFFTFSLSRSLTLSLSRSLALSPTHHPRPPFPFSSGGRLKRRCEQSVLGAIQTRRVPDCSG